MPPPPPQELQSEPLPEPQPSTSTFPAPTSSGSKPTRPKNLTAEEVLESLLANTDNEEEEKEEEEEVGRVQFVLEECSRLPEEFVSQSVEDVLNESLKRAKSSALPRTTTKTREEVEKEVLAKLQGSALTGRARMAKRRALEEAKRAKEAEKEEKKRQRLEKKAQNQNPAKRAAPTETRRRKPKMVS